jgi:hypothetical protein
MAPAARPRSAADHPVILAIDPGPVESAWLVYNPCSGGIRAFAKVDNEHLLRTLRNELAENLTTVVIEQIESFGMPVGREVFETVRWSGRFEEACGRPVEYLPRRTVKLQLCGSSRAKDPNVRQALIDRYGGSAAIGKKATPGPLYGISGDVWSALAVAVTWSEQRREQAA